MLQTLKVAIFSRSYAFLLGVIPATLSTLYVLGHSPLQLLLVGAYIVTVYLMNFGTGSESEDGSASSSSSRVDGTIGAQVTEQ